MGNLHHVGPLPHRSLAVLSAKHGPLMLLKLGQVPTLVVSSADAAREIMKNNNLIFSSRPPFKVAKSVLYGGTDMAFAPYGEIWRNVRKLCTTNLLSTKMVQSFRCIREEEVDIMIDNISSRAYTVINMSEVLNAFVNDILCRVVSKKFSSDQGRKKIIRELVHETSALLGTCHVGDYIPYLGWVDGLLGLDARARRNSKGWDDVLDEMIDKYSHADRTRGDEGQDLVDVLISLQKDPTMGYQLTRENIKGLLLDVLAAGTDPPFIVLEWAMAELVQNRQVMKKLQDEVRGIAGGKAKIQEEDLGQMNYLKNVLKEVLRLHPPLPVLVPRELMEDCCIKGYRIPSKTRVIVNEWVISRETKFWEAAEEFRPERFINNPIDYKGNDFQFIPFGAGRRICPGMNFAMAITEIALANLINQFEWELPNRMTKENLDMTETPGLASRKMHELELLVKPCSYLKG